MDNNTKSILIVGVGGQGTLLASKLLGNCLMEQGYDVKVGEVHGMSQRGGSVVTYVRYGREVFSPVIDKGEADMIIAFEQLEGARWLSYLKKGGLLITNTQKLNPMPVIMGKAEYPDDVIGKIKESGVRVEEIDALEIARECGNEKSTNVVLLGAAAKDLGMGEEIWLDIIKRTVPAKSAEINRKAFLAGYGKAE